MHDVNVSTTILNRMSAATRSIENGERSKSIAMFLYCMATFDAHSDLIDLAIRLKNLVLQASGNNRKCL